MRKGDIMQAFLIWALVSALFVGFGIRSFSSKEPTGFWANADTYEISDVPRYNRAMGKMWCVFGGFFLFLGIPLLAGQNSPLIFLSVLGIMIWVIGLMIVYEQVICKKYRKKRERE